VETIVPEPFCSLKYGCGIEQRKPSKETVNWLERSYW